MCFLQSTAASIMFLQEDRWALVFSNVLWKNSEFYFLLRTRVNLQNSEFFSFWLWKNSEFLFSIWVWPPCKAVTRQKLESGILRGYGANNRYKCASNNPFKTFFLIFRKSLFWPSFQTEICWKTLPSAASRQ